MPSLKQQNGFSLVEMAVVVVILGLVLGALLLPLQAQRAQIFQTQTENTLETARRALLGFAQANGRLPCPAIAASNGLESPLGGGTCTFKLGYLPAATLGIRPVDDSGFVIDGWNNRIMYAVAQHHAGGAATSDYTTTGDMNTVGITALQPELRVCLSSTGVTAAACSGGTESNYAINNAVAVIYSLGATGSLGSGGADENENPSAPAVDSVFVSHDITATSAANGEFDHLFTWISPYVLYNAMIEAGQLH
jgi:prepilin-type N-terminal cleavage/methylation domain-containing protein